MSSPVVRARGRGHHGLLITPDHRLYARPARQGLKSVEGHRDVYLRQPEWLAARDCEFGSGGRVRNTRWATPSDIAALPVDDDLPFDAMDPRWLWLFGRWLADGTVTTVDRAGHAAQWSVGLAKSYDVELRLKELGLHYQVRHGNALSDNIAIFNVYGKQLAAWLKRNGGRRAEGKHIPAWVYGLSRAQRAAVFDGICAGDGYPTGIHGQLTVSTVSRSLAFGLRVLAASMHWSASVSTEPAKPAIKFGRMTDCRELFKIAMAPSGGQTFTEDGVRWSAMTSVDHAGTAHVWDLSVEGDPSFVVEANEYVHLRINDEKLRDTGMPVEDLLEFPASHLAHGPRRGAKIWLTYDSNMRSAHLLECSRGI